MSSEKPFTFVKPAGMPEPDIPCSYGVKVKPGATWLYLSGLAPRTKDGTGLVGYRMFFGESKNDPKSVLYKVPTGIYTQTMRVMERLQGVLAAEGATFDDVVNARIFITQLSYWENGCKEAFAKHFKKGQYPTVSVLVVDELGVDQMVEIDLTAAI